MKFNIVCLGVWLNSGTAWRGPNMLLWPGLLSLGVYAFCLVAWPRIGSPAETIMAVMGLLTLVFFGHMRKSAALWLLLLAIAVQCASWILGYYAHPDWVKDNPQVDRLAKLFIFISVAWWLGGSTRKTFVVWGLAFVGYLLAMFTRGGGLSEWIVGIHGERVDFNIRNAQHTAMFFGLGLLGLLSFSQRCMAKGKWRTLRIILWTAAVAICFLGVLITQTRAVWLGLIIALPIMAMLFYLKGVNKQKIQKLRRKIFYAFLLLGILGAGVFGLAYKTVENRLEVERLVIEQVISGDLTELPYSSVGIRIHTWRAATEWIAERPWVGWGGQGRSLVIDHTEWLPQIIKDDFGHLHNYFLELWVAYGLLGVLVVAALAFWVGRATWLAWRGGVLPSDIALFGVVFFVYWIIINQFESYLSFWTGVYTHNLVVGGLITHYWRWQMNTGCAGQTHAPSGGS